MNRKAGALTPTSTLCRRAIQWFDSAPTLIDRLNLDMQR